MLHGACCISQTKQLQALFFFAPPTLMCPANGFQAGLRSTVCATIVSSSPVTLQHQGPDIIQLDAVLQEQRDHDNNRHLGNINIKPYSNRVCSWVCPLGTPDDPHCWEARVARRLQVARCPYCIGCRTSKVNSLAVVAPEKARAWDYTKNELTPADYTSQSAYKAHWKCPKCCFEWQAKIQTHVQTKSSCPQCSKAVKAQRHPTPAECKHALLALWDHKANALLGILPQNTRLRSHKKVNWVCKCCPLGLPHRWIELPANRNRLSTGRPCCSGHAVCKCNSFANNCSSSGSRVLGSCNICAKLLSCIVWFTSLDFLYNML
ncbi:TPA: hypothetical protein ACH3X2_013567 [Trebouxia sp. C0005]